MRQTMTVNEIEKKIKDLSPDHPKEAAEYAYAAAVISKKADDEKEASKFARRSIELLENLNLQTLEDASPINNDIAGVIIPDILHEDVVRSRFSELLK